MQTEWKTANDSRKYENHCRVSEMISENGDIQLINCRGLKLMEESR
jgi:hypothetical protein